jgi:hypothetical protein
MNVRRYQHAIACCRAVARLAPHIRDHQVMLNTITRDAEKKMIELRQRQIEQVNWLLDHQGQTNIPPPRHEIPLKR